MANLRDLKNVLEGFTLLLDELPVVAILPFETKVPIEECPFCVTDKTLYLCPSFEKGNKNKITAITARTLYDLLSLEEDDFLDCDIKVFIHKEDVYNIESIEGSGKQITFVCAPKPLIFADEEDDSNNDNKESDEEKINISVTSLEAKLIAEALKYYGEKVASSVGDSSGVKYWDLISKFRN